MAYQITIVGIGPGSRDYLLPAAQTAVNEADLLVGGESALSLFKDLDKEKCLIKSDLQGVLDYVAAMRETKRVVVLLSGDPGFFGLLPRLRKRFGVENLRVIPGISSLQLGCARLGLHWHDMTAASVHGRELEQLEKACSANKVAVLTDNRFTPAEVCRYFLERGCDFPLVWVLTDLGRPGEEITLTGLAEGAKLDGRGNSIVILLQEDSCGSVSRDSSVQDVLAEWKKIVTPGLSNELFIRSETPLSQEEARALVLCKARLRQGMVVYDLGAGTGGWTVETARLIAPGNVYAVERDPAAADLARANLKRFGLTNALVVTGEAPDACVDFPQADLVLVGGSGGRLQDIVQSAASRLRPGGSLVLSAVTPDTFSAAWQLLQGDSWEQLEAVLLQVSRVSPRGGARIFQGGNPIFILQAVRRSENAS